MVKMLQEQVTLRAVNMNYIDDDDDGDDTNDGSGGADTLTAFFTRAVDAIRKIQNIYPIQKW